jgi:hypothetical protein
MMKILLTVCWIATGQCQTLPWTGNRDFSGDPGVFNDADTCNSFGRYLATAHGGYAYVGHPDYDVKGFECVPE